MADDLITIGTYWDINEEQIAQLKLETSGIRSYLSNDTTVSMLWNFANATGGVKLHVASSDEQRARATLAENGNTPARSGGGVSRIP